MLITYDMSVTAMMEQLGEAVMLEQLEVDILEISGKLNEWKIPKLTKSELEIVRKAKKNWS